jgi:tetratricopeptide (TPR) repeat protein
MLSRCALSCAVLALLAVLPSCSWIDPEPTVHVTEALKKADPLTVAVLPMRADPDVADAETARAIRRVFYNHFAALAFQDVEMFRVDHVAAELKRGGRADLRKVPPEELGKLLGCDALIEGEITRHSQVYAAVYSQFAVGLKITMRDVKTGAVLLTAEHEVVSRKGGVPLSPVGAATELVTNAWHLRQKTFVDTTGDLCRQIVSRIPEPAIEKLLAPPKITDLKVGPVGRTLRAGDVVTVSLKSEPRCRATFKIRGLSGAVTMEESKPGEYEGWHTVGQGDNASNAEVLVRVTRLQISTERVYEFGGLHIDTAGPAPPAVLAATPGPSDDGKTAVVRLKWERSLDNDAALYRVYRAAGGGKPERIAETGDMAHVDAKATPEQEYTYTVSAVDAAENEGAPSKPMTALPVQPGPILTAGTIKADVTWRSGSSPYVLASKLTVAEGATLTIEPGTKVLSAGGGLVVAGRLIAKGAPGSPIVFAPQKTDAAWPGIVLSGKARSVLALCTVRKAIVGITCQAGSEPEIRSCTFTDTPLAVISNGALPVLVGNTFGGASRVRAAKAPALVLGGNFWGTLRPTEIQKRIEGLNVLASCLDAAQPDGVAIKLDALKHYEAALTNDKLAEKLPHLKAALVTDPRLVAAFVEISKLFAGRRKMKEAISYATLAIETNPKRPQAHQLRADLNMRAGRLEQAAADYETVAKLRPGRAETYQALSELYDQLGQPKKTADAFARYATFTPDNAAVQIEAARALRAVNENDRAVAPARRAVALQPDKHATRYLLASCLFRSGRTDAAIVEMKKCIDAAPREAQYRRGLALLYEHKGDTAAADAAWRRSLALDTSSKAAKAVKAYLDARDAPNKP